MTRRKSYYTQYKYSLIGLLGIITILIVYKLYLSTFLVPIPYNIFTKLIWMLGIIISIHISTTLAILLVHVSNYYMPKNKHIKKLKNISHLIIPHKKIEEYSILLVTMATLTIVLIYLI